MNHKLKYILLFVNCLVCYVSYGQTDSITSLAYDLEPVYIQATKLPKPWVKAATSVYQLPTIVKDQLMQNSLQEYLLHSPSIFTLNADNKAQDLRISIRGFGSRAAFGVRGVKIIVDGIPETTTDGQGQLDNLNLGIIERIEVLNNGSSALYGNASGGVINISTINENTFKTKDQFAHLGLGFHAYGGQQYQLTTGAKKNNTSLLFHTNHHQGDGYREHASFQSINFNLRLIHEWSESSRFEVIANYMNRPTADDPGGVDLETFMTSPRSARDRNLQFIAGEAVSQFKGSLRYSGQVSDRVNLVSYGFYSGRDFVGRLPFENSGMIELQRDFLGHGTSLTVDLFEGQTTWKSLVGYEISAQLDDRSRFDNLDGEQGARVLFQDEQFYNAGFCMINDVNRDNFTFNAALRYDFNQIQVQDKLLDNGDDSGSIDLNDFNYSLGLAYELAGAKSLFATYSTSFETPTLNELSNNPDGSGFNPNLRAQSANHFEMGLKGYLKQQSSFQVSLFSIASRDDLLPYEIEKFVGRTFFRNVGSINRTGLEMFLRHPFTDRFSVATNWSYNRFRFTEYELDGENYAGNVLPGLPDFQGFIQVDFTVLKHLKVNVQNQFFGKIFTSDSNDTFQRPVYISNISLKYSIKRARISWHPYIGVNNMFGTNYADNIRINAFGARYYEAAAPVFLYGGLRLKI